MPLSSYTFFIAKKLLYLIPAFYHFCTKKLTACLGTVLLHQSFTFGVCTKGMEFGAVGRFVVAVFNRILWLHSQARRSPFADRWPFSVRVLPWLCVHTAYEFGFAVCGFGFSRCGFGF